MIPLTELASILEAVISGVAGDGTPANMTERDRTIASVTAAGLKLARDLAASGQDPVQAIEQIRSAIPGVESADRTVDDAIRAKFPPKD